MSKLRNGMVIIIILICILLNIQNVKYADSTEKQPISYKAHVMNIGWQKQVNEGSIAGTTGLARRMEALQIYNNNTDFKIKYKAHVQNIGWQSWKNEGEIAGTTGKSLQMEAVQIKLENMTANQYSVKYRVHVQNIGWQDWKQDGEIAGTTGKSLRMEAIQIKIEKKDTNILENPQLQEYKKGIDVSVYQGNINWSKVKQARNTICNDKSRI